MTTAKKVARKSRTHRAAKPTVKSVNTCTFIEGTDGAITISLNGKELYSGADWSEGIETMRKTIYGISEQEENGEAPLGPHQYNPFTTDRNGEDLDVMSALLGFGDGDDALEDVA